MSFELLDTQVRESAPLVERLKECQDRIAKMCKERRPPKMTIPVQWNDDDIFIIGTLKEALEHLQTDAGESAAYQAVSKTNNLSTLGRKFLNFVGRVAGSLRRR